MAAGIHIYWLPLGVGGTGFVRIGGMVYEAAAARLQGRSRCDLYHTALEAVTGDARFTIETAWPSPNADTASRGVVFEGPVYSGLLGRLRSFRYEVRCWRDGVIPDAAHAVGGPSVLSGDPSAAARLVDLAPAVPRLTWGRDELRQGEMWNSNSVVSWLLARAGLPVEELSPPPGGRAPGWDAGIAASRSG